MGRRLCVICVRESDGPNLSSVAETGSMVSTYGGAEEVRNMGKTFESC